MKRSKIFYGIMLVILILLVAGCDNGMKDGGNKYEREEEVSIRLVVETDIGKAECFISGGKDLDKYNSAVIIVNGIPLENSSDGRFEIQNAALRLSTGKKIKVEIKHSALGFIEKEYEVPDYPKELKVEPDLKEILAGNEDRVTLSWEKTSCNVYFIRMKKSLLDYDDKVQENNISMWVTGTSYSFTKKDFEVYWTVNKEDKFGDADTVTLEIYGANGENSLMTFNNPENNSSVYGRLFIKINSPDKVTISETHRGSD